MKLKIQLVIALAFSLSIFNCKGPDGAVGPAGANGISGQVGATGATGAAGNANVVYSAWKPIVSMNEGVVTGGPDSKGSWNFSYFVLYSPKTLEPLFTKEAINTAAIYSYIKYNRLIPTNTGYELSEGFKLITNTTEKSFFQFLGRPNTSITSFANVEITVPVYNENYFSLDLIYDFNYFDNKTGRFVYNTQFDGKKAQDLKDLVKNTPQVRHVVVYGSTKGRLASINMNDYNEVKNALNLKD